MSSQISTVFPEELLEAYKKKLPEIPEELLTTAKNIALIVVQYTDYMQIKGLSSIKIADDSAPEHLTHIKIINTLLGTSVHKSSLVLRTALNLFSLHPSSHYIKIIGYSKPKERKITHITITLH